MDLLLHLIAKHKLNIFDIEIAVLLEQYLAQMEEMQRQDLDISSEFLEMAARLVYMKTVSLLPKKEEAQELQKELEGQLLDYQQYRQAAGQLAQGFTWDRLVREPQKLELAPTYRRTHSPQEFRRRIKMQWGGASGFCRLRWSSSPGLYPAGWFPCLPKQ